MEPKETTPVKCVFCEWSGILKDCKKEWVDNGAWHLLAGRRGWEWKCPECKFTVYSHYYMVS